jgi:hypothetical protein
MTDPLSLERFRDLADAYGSAVARWPEPYRDAAMRLASTPAAKDILAQASALDEALDTWRVPPPAIGLGDRLLADAPRPSGSFAVRAKLWWSGIGIAAALSGAVAGAAVVAMVAPIEAASDSGTSFGDVAAQES